MSRKCLVILVAGSVASALSAAWASNQSVFSEVEYAGLKNEGDTKASFDHLGKALGHPVKIVEMGELASENPIARLAMISDLVNEDESITDVVDVSFSQGFVFSAAQTLLATFSRKVQLHSPYDGTDTLGSVCTLPDGANKEALFGKKGIFHKEVTDMEKVRTKTNEAIHAAQNPVKERETVEVGDSGKIDLGFTPEPEPIHEPKPAKSAK